MIKNLVSAFDHIATTNADQIAYDEMGKKTRYGELKAAADSLAAWLDQQTLADHSPIMVFGDHQVEMIASFMAALKTGHAYIPVSSGSALPRIQSILDTGKPSLILAIDDFPADQLTVAAPIIDKTQLDKVFTSHHAFSGSHPVTGDDLAYILFTSGTTGSPKGVQVSHDNLVSFTNWMLSEEFNLPAKANYLGQPPYSFDLSNMFLYPALMSASTVKALPHDVVENFGQLFTALPTLNLNVFVGTPSFADMLMLSPAFSEKQMSHLTHFLFCGEELTVKTAKTLQKRFPHAHIFNTYGPTEATVAVSGIEITPEIVENSDRLPVGYAKPGVELSIWKDGKQVTTPDEQGEIIIAGDSVAHGYKNNPEKTVQSFFKLNGQNAYRTGDAGVLDEDGLLHHKGRMDFQIKLHGFRIELDEVRASLEKSPYIKQAVALPKYNKDGKVAHLIAAVIPKEAAVDQNELTTKIRESLKGLIMPYMMPTQFVYRESFPMSANGKIAVKQMIKEANQ